MNVLIPTEIKSITLSKDEVLLVRFSHGTIGRDQMLPFQERLCSMLQSQNILVYCADDIEFLKIRLEDKLINKLIDDEIQK